MSNHRAQRQTLSDQDFEEVSIRYHANNARFSVKKGELFCPDCFEKAKCLAQSSDGELGLHVAKYKYEMKILKLLDKTNWDKLKTPTIKYCLDCGEERCFSKADVRFFPADGENF